jgi:hypothetical protein
MILEFHPRECHIMNLYKVQRALELVLLFIIWFGIPLRILEVLLDFGLVPNAHGVFHDKCC